MTRTAAKISSLVLSALLFAPIAFTTVAQAAQIVA